MLQEDLIAESLVQKVVNPAYYGLEDADTRTVNSYLSRLVQNTLEDLEDSGSIKINENNVEPLMLGTVASQYYLSYMTVSMFGSNIGPDTSLEVFLHILSGATEYDELPVRHNEAHFSQLELPISDYVTDMKSVLDQSIRIIQAMIDICANSGWLSSAIACMHLLQMVMQGLWYGQDSPLLMLPCMSSDLLRFLNKEIELFPFLQVRIKLERNVKDGSRPSILIVKLESLNSRRKTTRAFAPRFPKIKEEAWWLILCNDATSELYTLKRVSLSKHVVTRMNFPSEPSNLKMLETLEAYVAIKG
ncbi:DExH-box ATP-dependent RNA helicase [Nymphaea thermarum]|nr:DExH-box ATP-dependent RNA helicase [Nymphaea thermarum]